MASSNGSVEQDPVPSRSFQKLLEEYGLFTVQNIDIISWEKNTGEKHRPGRAAIATSITATKSTKPTED